ncbi:MAG: sulfatase [Thermoplasmata archaeon]|nr:sulfatase [Thermoplasmata archaeon]
MADARPNFLVIVLDCVRADDFPGAPDAVTRMPFVESLLKESTRFERAVSPAPWTIPAHASLFTGLYPWEHGAHAKGNLKLDSSVPRLPQILRDDGYRTLSLSANHLLSPDLGLTEGFDRAAWAGWWEPYYRVPGATHPPHETEANGHGPRGLSRVRTGSVWSLLKRSSRAVYRYPFALDAAPGTGEHLEIAPWIEPTMSRWIGETPKDQPVFAFVNLLDGHEPYYPDWEIAPGLLEWWRYSRRRQDGVGWLSGDWVPKAPELSQLRTLCRQMVRSMDRRIAALVQAFKDAHRWENTYLLVTSDHGQAFGEHGMVFHMLRLDEPVIRIPFVFRAPRGEGGGVSTRSWASLVDVAPTFLDAAGLGMRSSGSGVPLPSLRNAPRPVPVYSAADGLVWKTIIPEHERGKLSNQRKEVFDRILVAAYEGDRKLLLDFKTDQVQSFSIDEDPGETRDLWPVEGARMSGLAEDARRVARLLQETRTPETSPDVEDRLRSWGYI